MHRLHRTVSIGLLLMLAGCSSLDTHYLPSQHYNSRVKYLVIHYTASNYQESLEHLVDKGKVSAHYLIPENHDTTYPHDDLRVIQLVDESYRAWHAGVSHWGGQDGLNDLSIGIELVYQAECHTHSYENLPADVKESDSHSERLCIYPDYDPEQIQLLTALIKRLQEQYPRIKPTHIVAHSDIAPTRKNDPGPRFPWQQLYKEGIGAWYDIDTMLRYWHMFAEQPPSLEIVQQALQDYGYPIEISGELDDQTESTLRAFQIHFLPWEIDGDSHLATTATLFALLEKYHPEKAEQLLYSLSQPVDTLSQPANTRPSVTDAIPQ